eukprot:c28682_g1_i1 orf=252-3233(-)
MIASVAVAANPLECSLQTQRVYRCGVLAKSSKFSSSQGSLFLSSVISSTYGRLLAHSPIHIKGTEMWMRNFSACTQILKKERVENAVLIDPSVTGDAIRERFLDFYAARGHEVIPSSSLVPDDPTVLLTIAGMLQFKPIFLGQVPRRFPRAVTSQKCIRTNDIESVGLTKRHHTFFEMLGNFSFGDYFKREAIKWAWELATEEFKLPIDHLWVSIFKDDDEALTIWRDEVGVHEEKIQLMGEDDNFWSSGPTGPCGPCSEMYYDFNPEKGMQNVDLGDDSRFIEFYNLVFMQYNRKEDGSLEPLQTKNIDTGLGLERMAQILQKVPNNYETDLIFPIIEHISELIGVKYMELDEQAKLPLKIIGDHARAVVYLISDGVYPSNVGRGYVVRRIIRRAVRMGRLLGIRGSEEGEKGGAFLQSVAEVVVNMSSRVDPDVKTNTGRIYEEIHMEELKFVRTLEKGEKLLELLLTEALAIGNGRGEVNPCLSGKDAFVLYDTYGFPVEITKEVAAESGVLVDLEGFEKEMLLQRKRSQAAHSTTNLAVGGTASELSTKIDQTEFLGYSTLRISAAVVALLSNGTLISEASKGDKVDIILNRTPFYAESGGQIGDHGVLEAQDENGNTTNCSVDVKDVQRSCGNLIVHKGIIKEGKLWTGACVNAVVDAGLRKRAMVHHTATHLLQSALKKVFGNDTCQAGSLVAFDRLRFDFNLPRPMMDNELTRVESLVNEWIGMAVGLQSKVMPLSDAKKAGAIAMFGEKYAEQVRVVEIPGISLELCGGTHVGNTTEIQGFKIISEQGIASSVRRIEAVAGPAFVEYSTLRDAIAQNLSSILKVKVENLPTRVAALLDEVKATRKEASKLRVQLAIAKADVLASKAMVFGPAGVRILVGVVEDVDADSLKVAVEYLLNKLGDPAAVALGSCPGECKVSLAVAFSPKVVQCGLQANEFLGGIACICGGGGGGTRNFAQAGGKRPEKLVEALDKAQMDLRTALSSCN